jgi:hypothetical protein
MTSSDLKVTAVESKADFERFLRVPWRIYREDPQWVPPLLMERRDHLNPKKNPFFDFAEVAYWLAWRGGEVVGRISAQVNRAHLARHNDASGHFGFLEAIDDPAVFAGLLDAACGWLKARGLTRVLGPFSLSINDESGLLVSGFETPPCVMMGHARPYYGPRLEEQGFQKAKDLLAYHYDDVDEMPATITKLIAKAGKSQRFVIRSLNTKRYREDLNAIMDIFNDAWSDNWNFVPFSDAEIAYLAKNIRPLIDPRYVAIAEINGRPVAMAIALPNLNEAIADLDGRLLPFGWAKLLWRLKVKTTKTVRMPLMGVRRQYHGSALGAALAFSVIDAVRRHLISRGVTAAELSWILEDNSGVRQVVESLNATVSKVYRVYEREL